jgi:hypothetical protein
MLWISVIIAVFLLAGASYVLQARWKKHRLSGVAKKRTLLRLQQLDVIHDLHRRVLEADSILDAALGELGYTGSMADKLRKAEKYIVDLEAVWRAHKVRNRIAHEPGMQLTENQAQLATSSLVRATKRFCS